MNDDKSTNCYISITEKQTQRTNEKKRKQERGKNGDNANNKIVTVLLKCTVWEGCGFHIESLRIKLMDQSSTHLVAAPHCLAIRIGLVKPLFNPNKRRHIQQIYYYLPSPK